MLYSGPQVELVAEMAQDYGAGARTASRDFRSLKVWHWLQLAICTLDTPEAEVKEAMSRAVPDDSSGPRNHRFECEVAIGAPNVAVS